MTERLHNAVESSKARANQLYRDVGNRADLAVRRDPWNAVSYAFIAGVAATAAVGLGIAVATMIAKSEADKREL